MISCKRATELISQKIDLPLSYRDRLSLWVHLVLCFLCRRFALQIECISKALKNDSELTPDELLIGVPVEAREKLKRALEKASGPKGV